MDRRRFLKLTTEVQAALVVATTEAACGGALAVVSGLIEAWGSPAPTAARQMLVGTGLRPKIIPSTRNPFRRKVPNTGFTAPSFDAARAIAGALDLDWSAAVIRPDVLAMDAGGDLVVIGGPLSNPFTQAVLGLDGVSPTLVSARGSRFRFPIYFEIERDWEEFADGTSGSGAGVLPTIRKPNWSIRYGDERLRARIEDGYVTEDFLLLTRLPNVFDDKVAFSPGIAIVSGANGAATRGVAQLLSPGPLLDELAEALSKRGDPPAWQALVRFPSILRVLERPDSPGQILAFEVLAAGREDLRFRDADLVLGVPV
jgi:hypothetical protein